MRLPLSGCADDSVPFAPTIEPTTAVAGLTRGGTIFATPNTQLGIHNQAQCGAAVSAMLAPSPTAATESGAILIAVTTNTKTATDVVFFWLEVNAMT